jgi:hypothetical protein
MRERRSVTPSICMVFAAPTKAVKRQPSGTAAGKWRSKPSM